MESNLSDFMDLSEMMKEAGPISGYADGWYVSTCRQCKRRFMGDKRASECLPCAIRSLKTLVNEPCRDCGA